MHTEPHTSFHLVRAASVRPDLGGVEAVVSLVSGHKGIPISLIFSHSRCRIGVARARQLAMYLSHVILGESLTAIGLAFGRDRTTVSYACGLIEDMRDDPAFDAEVSALELVLLGEGA